MYVYALILITALGPVVFSIHLCIIKNLIGCGHDQPTQIGQ